MNRTQNFARSAAPALLAALILGLTAPSQAFQMLQAATTGRVTAGFLVACSDPGGFAHWSTPNTTWFHNTGGQGLNAAAALQAAMNSWTNVPNASHILTYAGTTTAGFATDGINAISWGTGNGCADPCLALTALVIQSGQLIVESDITFNDAEAWRSNGADFDIQAVATHELGHGLGIHHTDLTAALQPTMSAVYFGTDGRTLEADDQAALQCSQTKYVIPAVPSSLNVHNDVCFGYNSVNWTAAARATSYQLYSSTSSSFTSPHLEYSGPDLSDSVNVPGTRYLRVRACNSYGCSAYRVGNHPAHYVDSCD